MLPRMWNVQIWRVYSNWQITRHFTNYEQVQQEIIPEPACHSIWTLWLQLFQRLHTEGEPDRDTRGSRVILNFGRTINGKKHIF